MNGGIPGLPSPDCDYEPYLTKLFKQVGAETDIRRVHETRCDVGQYLILRNDKIEDRVDSYVNAEIKAHTIARAHPGYRVVVAKAVLEVKGVPHIYEVHPK